MSEKWRQSEIRIVINDTLGSRPIAKHLCFFITNLSFYLLVKEF